MERGEMYFDVDHPFVPCPKVSNQASQGQAGKLGM
tara:strand:- start:500 stop:604 length:105 start_codon:yes stop_codon:yes gene_type:complete